MIRTLPSHAEIVCDSCHRTGAECEASGLYRQRLRDEAKAEGWKLRTDARRRFVDICGECAR